MLPTRALTVGLFLVAAAAQAQVRPEPLCFRGRPLPACQSFLLVELAGDGQVFATSGIPVAGQTNTTKPDGYVSIDLGAMVNSDRTAIGGTAEIGIGQRHLRRLALELRHRRWLSDRIAFDVGAGPLEINGRESYALLQPGAGYGATAHAGLVLMDLATVTTSVDLVQGRRTSSHCPRGDGLARTPA